MFRPFVIPGVEERGFHASLRVVPMRMNMFEAVAAAAGEGEVVVMAGAAIYHRHDVFDIE